MIISVIKGEKLSKPTSVCLSFILHTHNHNTWAHHRGIIICSVCNHKLSPVTADVYLVFKVIGAFTSAC